MHLQLSHSMYSLEGMDSLLMLMLQHPKAHTDRYQLQLGFSMTGYCLAFVILIQSMPGHGGFRASTASVYLMPSSLTPQVKRL